MSEQAEHDLHLRDMHSIRVAEARHEVIAGGYRKRHRNKYKVTVNYDNQNEPDAYDPGMEPILWYIVWLDFANFYNYDLYYPFV